MEKGYWDREGTRRTMNSGGRGPRAQEDGARGDQSDQGEVSNNPQVSAVQGEPEKNPEGQGPVSTNQQNLLRPPLPPRRPGSRSPSTRGPSPVSSRPPTPDPRKDSRRSSLNAFELPKSLEGTPLGAFTGHRLQEEDLMLEVSLLSESASQEDLDIYLHDLEEELEGYEEYTDIWMAWKLPPSCQED